MQKLTENYVSSNAKIKMALGVERFPVNAREGLKETIRCFKEGGGDKVNRHLLAQNVPGNFGMRNSSFMKGYKVNKTYL